MRNYVREEMYEKECNLGREREREKERERERELEIVIRKRRCEKG
jgi:hypothetical protein